MPPRRPPPQWWRKVAETENVAAYLTAFMTALGKVSNDEVWVTTNQATLDAFVAEYERFETATIHVGASGVKFENALVFLSLRGKLEHIVVNTVHHTSEDVAKLVKLKYETDHPGMVLTIKPTDTISLPLGDCQTYAARGLLTDSSLNTFGAAPDEPLATVIKYTHANGNGLMDELEKTVYVVPEGALETVFEGGLGSIGTMVAPCGHGWVTVATKDELRRLYRLTTAINPVVHLYVTEGPVDSDQHNMVNQLPVFVDMFDTTALYEGTTRFTDFTLNSSQLQQNRERAKTSLRPAVSLIARSTDSAHDNAVCVSTFIETLAALPDQTMLDAIYEAVSKWARGSPVILYFNNPGLQQDKLSDQSTKYPLIHGTVDAPARVNAGFTHIYVDKTSHQLKGTYSRSGPAPGDFKTHIESVWADNKVEETVNTLYPGAVDIDALRDRCFDNANNFAAKEAGYKEWRILEGTFSTEVTLGSIEPQPPQALVPAAAVGGPTIAVLDGTLTQFTLNVGTTHLRVAYAEPRPDPDETYVQTEAKSSKTHEMWNRIETRLGTLPRSYRPCTANSYTTVCSLLTDRKLLDPAAIDLEFTVDLQREPEVGTAHSTHVVKNNLDFEAVRKMTASTCAFTLDKWTCAGCRMSHTGKQQWCNSCAVYVTAIFNEQEMTPEAVELKIDMVNAGSHDSNTSRVYERLKQPLPTKTRFHLTVGTVASICRKTRIELGIAVPNDKLTCYTRDLAPLESDDAIGTYFIQCRSTGAVPSVIVHAKGWRCGHCYNMYCRSSLNKASSSGSGSAPTATAGPDPIKSVHAYRWTHSPYAKVCPLLKYAVNAENLYISVQGDPTAGLAHCPQNWSSKITDKSVRIKAEKFAGFLMSHEPSGCTNWALHAVLSARDEKDLNKIKVEAPSTTANFWASPLAENNVYSLYSTRSPTTADKKKRSFGLTAGFWHVMVTDMIMGTNFSASILELSVQPKPEMEKLSGPITIEIIYEPGDCIFIEYTATRDTTACIYPVFKDNSNDTYKFIFAGQEAAQDWATWEGMLARTSDPEGQKIGAFNGLFRFELADIQNMLDQIVSRHLTDVNDCTAGVYTLRKGDVLRIQTMLKELPSLSAAVSRSSYSALETEQLGGIRLSNVDKQHQYDVEMDNWRVVGKKLSVIRVPANNPFMQIYAAARPLKPSWYALPNGGPAGMLNQLNLAVDAWEDHQTYLRRRPASGQLPLDVAVEPNPACYVSTVTTMDAQWSVTTVTGATTVSLPVDAVKRYDLSTDANVWVYTAPENPESVQYYAECIKLRDPPNTVEVSTKALTQRANTRGGAAREHNYVPLVLDQSSSDSTEFCWHQHKHSKKWEYGRRSAFVGGDYHSYKLEHTGTADVTVTLSNFGKKTDETSTLCYTPQYFRSLVHRVVQTNDVVVVFNNDNDTHHGCGRCDLPEAVTSKLVPYFTAKPRRAINEPLNDTTMSADQQRLKDILGVGDDVQFKMNRLPTDANGRCTLSIARVAYKAREVLFAADAMESEPHLFKELQLPNQAAPIKMTCYAPSHISPENWTTNFEDGLGDTPEYNPWGPSLWQVWYDRARKRLDALVLKTATDARDWIITQLATPFADCDETTSKTVYSPKPDKWMKNFITRNSNLGGLSALPDDQWRRQGSLYTLLRGQTHPDDYRYDIAECTIEFDKTVSKLEEMFESHDAANDPLPLDVTIVHPDGSLRNATINIYKRVTVMERRLLSLASDIAGSSSVGIGGVYSVGRSPTVSNPGGLTVKYTDGATSVIDDKGFTVNLTLSHAVTDIQHIQLEATGALLRLPVNSTVNAALTRATRGTTGANLLEDIDVTAWLALVREDMKKEPWYNFAVALAENGLLVVKDSVLEPAGITNNLPKVKMLPFDKHEWETNRNLKVTYTLQAGGSVSRPTLTGGDSDAASAQGDVTAAGLAGVDPITQSPLDRAKGNPATAKLAAPLIGTGPKDSGIASRGGRGAGRGRPTGRPPVAETPGQPPAYENELIGRGPTSRWIPETPGMPSQPRTPVPPYTFQKSGRDGKRSRGPRTPPTLSASFMATASKSPSNQQTPEILRDKTPEQIAQELHELDQEIAGFQPEIDDINRRLNSFGLSEKEKVALDAAYAKVITRWRKKLNNRRFLKGRKVAQKDSEQSTVTGSMKRKTTIPGWANDAPVGSPKPEPMRQFYTVSGFGSLRGVKIDGLYKLNTGHSGTYVLQTKDTTVWLWKSDLSSKWTFANYPQNQRGKEDFVVYAERTGAAYETPANDPQIGANSPQWIVPTRNTLLDGAYVLDVNDVPGQLAKAKQLEGY